MTASPPPLMSTSDVCETLGIHKSTLYRLREENQFPPPIKALPGKSVWLRADFEKWLSDQSTYRQPADVA